ncbi:uncharacterized protein [Amphiura filiformis]|uniref:uncharacterized protein n=1 Tax=Amphiura filiformis TaxID=82378 RepID=UPI003B228F52
MQGLYRDRQLRVTELRKMATKSNDGFHSRTEEKCTTVRFSLLKQLGITRIINILHSKGSMSLFLLGSLFAIRASEEEREIVGIGWKLQDLLNTLRGFPSLFTITSTGPSYHVGLKRNLRRDNKTGEVSLMLALGFLKMRDSLLMQQYLKVDRLYELLSTAEEQRVWGETLAAFSATLRSLPDIFHVRYGDVSLIYTSKFLPSEFLAHPTAVTCPEVFKPQFLTPNPSTDQDLKPRPCVDQALDTPKEAQAVQIGVPPGTDNIPPSSPSDIRSITKFWLNDEQYRNIKINGINSLKNVKRMPRLEVSLQNILECTNDDAYNNSVIKKETSSSDDLSDLDAVKSKNLISDGGNRFEEPLPIRSGAELIQSVKVEPPEAEWKTDSMPVALKVTHCSRSLSMESSKSLRRSYSSESSGSISSEQFEDVRVKVEPDDSDGDDDVFEPPAPAELPGGIPTSESIIAQYPCKSNWSPTLSDEVSSIPLGREHGRIKVEPLKDTNHVDNIFKTASAAIAKLPDHKPTRFTTRNDSNVQCASAIVGEDYKPSKASIARRNNGLQGSTNQTVGTAVRCIKQEPVKTTDEETAQSGSWSHLHDSSPVDTNAITDRVKVNFTNEYLSSQGARTIHYISNILAEHQLGGNIPKSSHLRQVLEKQSTLFHIHDVNPFSPKSDGSLVCLQDQKTHLKTAIDVLVAYLIEKQGKCKMQGVLFLVCIMPAEAARVAALTPTHWQETITAAAGDEFTIQGDNIVLRNFSRWKRLIDTYNNKMKKDSNSSGSDEETNPSERKGESQRKVGSQSVVATAGSSLEIPKVSGKKDADDKRVPQNESSSNSPKIGNGEVSNHTDTKRGKRLLDTYKNKMKKDSNSSGPDEETNSSERKSESQRKVGSQSVVATAGSSLEIPKVSGKETADDKRVPHSDCQHNDNTPDFVGHVMSTDAVFSESSEETDSLKIPYIQRGLQTSSLRASPERSLSKPCARSQSDNSLTSRKVVEESRSRKATTSNEMERDKSLLKPSAHERGFNTMKNQMKAKGVQTVVQLFLSLQRDEKDAIGKNPARVKRTIAADTTTHGFRLIEPLNFEGYFEPGQVIVCLPQQLSMFWKCMQWVKTYVLHNWHGKCRFSDFACGVMLDYMSHDMKKLFNHTPIQLRFCIFAAANRPEYFRITREYPLSICVDSKTCRTGLSDITNQGECLTCGSQSSTRRTTVSQQQHYKLPSKDKGLKKQTASSLSPEVSPTLQIDDGEKCTSNANDITRSRKRKLTAERDHNDIENKPLKKKKTTNQEHDSDPHLLSALRRLEDYLYRRGPRRCEQLKSYLAGDPLVSSKVQKAVGNHSQLLQIMKTHETFIILKRHTDPKHCVIWLSQYQQQLQKYPSSNSGGKNIQARISSTVMTVSPDILPVLQLSKGKACASSPKDGLHSRKRQLSDKHGADVENKPAKKSKTMHNETHPHLLSALKKFEKYIAKKGPKTCQQLYHYLRSCGHPDEQKAVGYIKLWEAVRTWHNFDVLETRGDPMFNVIGLVGYPGNRYH